MPGFQRVQPISEGTIRGPARIIVAPITIAFPSKLADMINLAVSGGGYLPEKQSVAVTGTPTGGTFTLTFQSIQTAPIAYNATSTAVAAALNAISSVASSGGVTATGGPVQTAPVILTWGANGNQPLLFAPSTGNALTGGVTPSVAILETQAGNGQFDVVPGSGWFELGSTRSGVQVGRNNTEDQLDVDQVYGTLLGVPNEWEMTIATQLAETTLENIKESWECGAIVVDVAQSPNERHLPMGNPLAYTQRKLAVLHQKTIGPAAGRIRAQVFRSVTRSPQNSTLDYQKAGQMQTIAQTWRAYADPTITNDNARMGEIIEQQAF